MGWRNYEQALIIRLFRRNEKLKKIIAHAILTVKTYPNNQSIPGNLKFKMFYCQKKNERKGYISAIS